MHPPNLLLHVAFCGFSGRCSFIIALGGNSRRESALPFRGPRKIGPAVPTLTLARRTRRNPSFRPPSPARVASPTLLSHGEVIESVRGGRQDHLKTMLQQRQLKITVVLFVCYYTYILGKILDCPLMRRNQSSL
mgnify:CR=1 FL=1